MKKLKEDWALATNKEKIKFILVIIGILIAGGFAIYGATLYALNESTNGLIITIFGLIVVNLFSHIRTKPKACRENENKIRT